MTITDEAREAWKLSQIQPCEYDNLVSDAIRSLTAQLMRQEFHEKHRLAARSFTGDVYCPECESKEKWAAMFDEPTRALWKLDRERHNWTKEQWERAAEEELSK